MALIYLQDINRLIFKMVVFCIQDGGLIFKMTTVTY